MSIVTVRFPSPEEEERNRRFQVHKNYLGAIDLYFAEEHGWDATDRLRALLQRQRALRGFRRIQRSRPADPGQLTRFLMLSWASEAQLRVHRGAEGAILPYANPWAPVHSYYAVYMACVAWLSAQGHPHATNHRAVLTSISQQVSERKLLPLPWSIYASGCPDTGETEWLGSHWAPTRMPGLSCSRTLPSKRSGPVSARCLRRRENDTSRVATKDGAGKTIAESPVHRRSGQSPRGSRPQRCSTFSGACGFALTTKTSSSSSGQVLARRGTGNSMKVSAQPADERARDQLGFKGWSQHSFVGRSVGVCRGLRRGFSSRGSCVVGR